VTARRTRVPLLAIYVGVVVAGAIASLIVGGFVILFLGAAMAVTVEKQAGTNLDHAVWLVSLVAGPLIVGACTAAVAIVVPFPAETAKARTVVALAIGAGLTTLGMFAAHADGSIKFMVAPPWWVLYVCSVIALGHLVVRLWEHVST
jgi:hypothetical protein